MQQLAEENQQLKRELNKLKREFRSLNDLYMRSQHAAAAKASITAMIDADRAKQEKYLQMLLKNSPDGMILFDREGRFVYYADAFLRLSGLGIEDLIVGKPFREVFRGVARETALSGFAEAFERAISEEITVEFDVEDGFFNGEGDRFYTITIAPMQEKWASVDGAIVVFHDLTEVVRARRMAERASSAKSDFLANMSHEMRTPMNAIIGMTNIALGAQDTEKKDYCLRKITDASSHLLGVINDVLDMSKIEANKLELSPEEFCFEKMLMRVCDVIAFPLETKKQIFSVSIDRAVPAFICADEQRLSQVIANLLSNAVKFTPEGGEIALSASLLSIDQDVYELLIRVTDTGIGLSEAQQSTLFQSFQQADGSIARRFGGTGLGLAISKKIVEMMGGRIWIESKEGEGSTFAFTIRAPMRETRAPLLPRTGQHLKILAVDDAPDVREFFEALTDRLDITLDVASGGPEALKMIGECGGEPYNLFFIDYRMPGIDGIELTRRIKNMENGGNPVVIMITAADWARIEGEARASGVDRFISKPLFPSSVIDAIDDIFGGDGDGGERDEHSRYRGAFAGKRVLLAEDVEINQEIVRELLADTGVEIVCANDGKAALEMFLDAPEDYHMIFMDIHMPEMDGYEATRRLRSLDDPWAKKIPIIAMTANVFKEDIDRCMDAGMNGHVGKPIDIDEVLERLREYL